LKSSVILRRDLLWLFILKLRCGRTGVTWHRRMLLCFWAQFLRSSSFLGFNLQITCLRTWKQSSLLCKVSWGLLNLHFCLPSVLTILHFLLICRLHDFFVHYFKKPLKLLCFRKTRITDSNIENITKVPKS